MSTISEQSGSKATILQIYSAVNKEQAENNDAAARKIISSEGDSIEISQEGYAMLEKEISENNIEQPRAGAIEGEETKTNAETRADGDARTQGTKAEGTEESEDITGNDSGSSLDDQIEDLEETIEEVEEEIERFQEKADGNVAYDKVLMSKQAELATYQAELAVLEAESAQML